MTKLATKIDSPDTFDKTQFSTEKEIVFIYREGNTFLHDVIEYLRKRGLTVTVYNSSADEVLAMPADFPASKSFIVTDKTLHDTVKERYKDNPLVDSINDIQTLLGDEVSVHHLLDNTAVMVKAAQQKELTPVIISSCLFDHVNIPASFFDSEELNKLLEKLRTLTRKDDGVSAFDKVNTAHDLKETLGETNRFSEHLDDFYEENPEIAWLKSVKAGELIVHYMLEKYKSLPLPSSGLWQTCEAIFTFADMARVNEEIKSGKISKDSIQWPVPPAKSFAEVLGVDSIGKALFIMDDHFFYIYLPICIHFAQAYRFDPSQSNVKIKNNIILEGDFMYREFELLEVMPDQILEQWAEFFDCLKDGPLQYASAEYARYISPGSVIEKGDEETVGGINIVQYVSVPTELLNTENTFNPVQSAAHFITERVLA